MAPELESDDDDGHTGFTRRRAQLLTLKLPMMVVVSLLLPLLLLLASRRSAIPVHRPPPQLRLPWFGAGAGAAPPSRQRVCGVWAAPCAVTQ